MKELDESKGKLKKVEKAIKPQKKSQPQLHAIWNLSERQLIRMDQLLWQLDFHYQQILTRENSIVKFNLIPFITTSKCLYTYISQLGENKKLLKEMNSLYKDSQTIIKKLSRRRSLKISDDLFERVDDIITEIKITLQKQGTGITAEQKRKDIGDWDFR